MTSSYNFSEPTASWAKFILFNKEGIGANNIGSFDIISGPLFGRVKSTGEVLTLGSRTQTAIFTNKAVNLFNKYVQK